MAGSFNHPSSLTNTPEISVGDLSLAIKNTIEGAFGFVRVRGELSKVTLAKSGHLYTALKDDVAVLDAVCWKGTVMRLGIKPEEGMEVVCTGRLTTYPGRSNYQLVIESMELAGVGAILKMLEERKKKLAAEGLFDASRKKPLPYLPRTIGVVTSPTGAVIRDILHRIADRFPCHVIVWPAVVQGATAAAEVVRGIEGLNAWPTPPDLIIVARGGGSFEDLMPFNDEAVVRAAAASKVPLISAVGHETDVTLIDFAADMRAPTPTGAAEMAVPVRENLLAQVLDDEQRLLQTMVQRLEAAREKIISLARPLASPARILEAPTQRLDRAAMQAEHGFERSLARSESKLARLALRTPADVVNAATLKLKNAGERMKLLEAKMFDKSARDVDALARMLESLSFKKVLERGYAVLRDEDGKLVGRKKSVSVGKAATVTLYDGDIGVEIKKI